MPKNLTDDASTFPIQTAPNPGEPRTAASVETPFQRAANRAAYIKDRVDNIDPTREGVRRLRRFASIAALRASGDYPNKTIAQVDGVGIYQFDAASEATDAEPFIVTPTAIGVGAGRWIWSAFGALNVPNGVPQLDGDAKVPAARLAICDLAGKVQGTHVAFGRKELITSYSPLSTNLTNDDGWVDVDGSEFFVNLELGDIVLVDVGFAVGSTADDDVCASRLRVVDPGFGTNDVFQGHFKTLGSYVLQQRLTRNYYPAVAGTHRFLAQAQASAGNTGATNVTYVTARVEVVRP